mmetsp:Transcript_6728/g.17325  ORF Transcript_6728/g.17325 Transcript_6728/m.17325 type:complete len:874 (+) Transcript_6728:721-3342(+)
MPAVDSVRSSSSSSSSSSWPGFIRLVWQSKPAVNSVGGRQRGGGFAASRIAYNDFDNDHDSNNNNNVYELCLDQIQMLQQRLAQLQQRLTQQRPHQGSILLPPSPPPTQSLALPQLRASTATTATTITNRPQTLIQSRKIRTQDIILDNGNSLPEPNFHQLLIAATQSLSVATGLPEESLSDSVSLWFRDSEGNQDALSLILNQQDLILALQQQQQQQQQQHDATTDCLEILVVVEKYHSHQHHSNQTPQRAVQDETILHHRILQQGPAFFKLYHSPHHFRLVSKERLWSALQTRNDGEHPFETSDGGSQAAQRRLMDQLLRMALDVRLDGGVNNGYPNQHGVQPHYYQLVIPQIIGDDGGETLVLVNDDDLLDTIAAAGNRQELSLHVVSRNSAPFHLPDKTALTSNGRSSLDAAPPRGDFCLKHKRPDGTWTRHQFDSNLIFSADSLSSYQQLCQLVAGAFDVHSSRVVVSTRFKGEMKRIHDDSSLLDAFQLDRKDEGKVELEVSFTRAPYIQLSWMTAGQDTATFGTDSIVLEDGAGLSLQTLRELVAMKYSLSPDFLLLFSTIDDDNGGTNGANREATLGEMLDSDERLLNLAQRSRDDVVSILTRPVTISVTLARNDGEHCQLDLDIRQLLVGGGQAMPSWSQLRDLVSSSWHMPSIRSFAMDDGGSGSNPIRSDEDLLGVVLLPSNLNREGKISIIARGGDKQSIHLTSENALLSDSLTMGAPEEDDYPPPLEFRCAPDVAVWDLGAAGVTVPGNYRAVLEVSSDGVGTFHAGIVSEVWAANNGGRSMTSEWKELRKIVPQVKFGCRSFEKYERATSNLFPVRSIHGDKFAVADAGSCFNIRSITLELVEPLPKPVSRLENRSRRT